MKMTKAEIEKLLKVMEENGINEVGIDVATEYTVDVFAIDFNVYSSNGVFVETLLTIE